MGVALNEEARPTCAVHTSEEAMHRQASSRGHDRARRQPHHSGNACAIERLECCRDQGKADPSEISKTLPRRAAVEDIRRFRCVLEFRLIFRRGKKMARCRRRPTGNRLARQAERDL